MPLSEDDLKSIDKEIERRGTTYGGGRSSDGSSDAREGGLLSDPLGSVVSFGKGAAKGALGDVVGAGQVIGGGEEALFGTHHLSDWAGSSTGLRDIKDWTMAPSTSAAETAGSWVGSTAPFLLAPEALGGGVIAGGLRGALAGGLQPTAEGTLSSHAPGAAIGAGIGVAPGIAGALGHTGLHALAAAARMAGIHVPHTGALINFLNILQNRGALSQLIPATGGMAAGQTFGQGTTYGERPPENPDRPSSQ